MSEKLERIRASWVESSADSAHEVSVTSIEPLVLDRGKTRIPRKRLCFAGGACVVLHEKPAQLKGRDPVIDLLIRAGAKKIDDPRITSPAFINCHAYACFIDGIPGIDHRMWVEGNASRVVDDVNSLQVILDHYFTPVFKTSRGKEREIAGGSFTEGDFVTFLDGNGDFIHSGILMKENGENWVVSKMGEGDILLAPLGLFKNAYDYKSIEVHRRR